MKAVATIAVAIGVALLAAPTGGLSIAAALGFTGATAVAVGVAVGATLAIAAGVAMKALFPTKVAAPTTTGGTPTVFRQTITNSTIAYGLCRLGGLLSFYHPKQVGSDHYRYFVVTHAGHRVHSATQLILNDDKVDVDGSGMVVTGAYANAAWWWFDRGADDAAANTTFVAECDGQWTEAHRGRGIAKSYFKFKMTDAVVQAGMPNMTVLVQGKDDILDPRTDARGYTDNAELVFYDWCALPRAEGGHGLADDEIDWDFVAANASVCDETVAGRDGTTEKRYTLNGTITTGAQPADVRDSMIVNCAGRFSWVEGQLLMRPGYWVPPSASLVEGDLAGAITVSKYRNASEIADQVTGTYLEPAYLFQPQDFAAQGAATVDAEQMSLDLAFTIYRGQAERVASIMLKRAEAEKSVQWPMNIMGLHVSAMDTVQLATARHGLSNYAWSVADWQLTSDFGVTMTMTEENEDIYAEPAISSLTIGATIAPAAVVPGPATYVRFIYRRAASQPATPATGSGLTPVNWATTPPQGSDPLWMSQATFHGDAELSDWSQPVRLDGDATIFEGSSDYDPANPGAAHWHLPPAADDLYIRISTNGGQNFGDPFRIVGEAGSDGQYQQFAFIRQASAPSTPGENGVPTGWSDGVPAGDASIPVWMSASTQLNGVLQGSWSTPRQISGPKGDTGATGPKGDSVQGLPGATGPAGQDAPAVLSQWSSDNSSWHNSPAQGDQYIRFSYNNGASWGPGFPIVGKGVKFAFYSDTNQPATPQSAGTDYPPYGWSQSPSATGIWWGTYATFDASGVITSTWATPFRVTGAAGSTGATGPAGSNAPQLQLQFSVNGSSNWHYPFQAGDLYLRMSSDGGANFGQAQAFVGKGLKFAFYGPTESQPAAPSTGGTDYPPYGWQANPGTTGTWWASSAAFDANGVIVQAWNTPFKITGVAGGTGATGPAGNNGSDGSPPFTMINHVNTTISGGKVTKTGGSAGSWDTSARSAEAWVNGAQFSMKAGTGGGYMGGLDNNPDVSTDYTNLAYGWYVSSDSNRLEIYESGVGVYQRTNVAGWAASDILSIQYDNAFVRYYINGIPIRTVAASAGQNLFASVIIRDAGRTVEVTGFAAAGSKGDKGDTGSAAASTGVATALYPYNGDTASLYATLCSFSTPNSSGATVTINLDMYVNQVTNNQSMKFVLEWSPAGYNSWNQIGGTYDTQSGADTTGGVTDSFQWSTPGGYSAYDLRMRRTSGNGRVISGQSDLQVIYPL